MASRTSAGVSPLPGAPVQRAEFPVVAGGLDLPGAVALVLRRPMMLRVEHHEARRPSRDVLDLGVLDEGGDSAGDAPVRGAVALRSRRRALAALAVVGLCAALAAAAASASPPPAPGTTAAGTTSPAADASRRDAAGPAPSASRPPVLVTDLGHPLLGTTTGWDVFARGDHVLVRVHPLSGRVTLTALPFLGDGGLSLVPARQRVLVHPADYRRGYVVPDDRPAVDLPLALNGSGPLLPGPDQDHVWVPLDDRRFPGLGLVTLTGAWTGVSAPAPPYATRGPITDGAGYLLFEGVGGVYRAGQGPPRRVSQGTLLAVGPPGWLTVECDDGAVCRTVLRDRTGRHRVVPAALGPQGSLGALSPDGITAALPVPGQIGTTGLLLVDLRSGERRAIPLSLVNTEGEPTLAWSPDGRWLLAVDVSGRIQAVDARTGRTSALAPGLPSVVQLAVRGG